MGFADLSITQTAAGYSKPVEKAAICMQATGNCLYKTLIPFGVSRIQRQLLTKFCLKHAQAVLVTQ